MKKLAFLPALLIAVSGFAQPQTELFQLINPSSVAVPKGYSQAAVVDLGTSKMLIISGQVAFDKLGNLVGKDDLEKQTEQVFRNIENIVKEAGGSMNDLVKLGYFTTDVSKIQAIRSVRDKFINVKNPPASTLVQISKLFREDVLIEIEATAIVPKKQN